MHQTLLTSALLLFFLACSGCSANKAALEKFHLTLAHGEYQDAKKLSVQKIGSRNTNQDLLWNLQAATLERILKNYETSNMYFERAEDSFRHYDQQLAAGKSVQASKSILFNDSLLPYVGKSHDRIMVNTYKALNYAALGEKQNARVEFNRALQRQNDAKTIFAAQAESLRNKLSAEKDGLRSGRDTIESSDNNPNLDKIIYEKYRNLDGFKVYADFVNPFATYMAGLFFWLEGDLPKAADILKEAYAMNEGQKTIASDFARADRGEVPSNELWIIFENGLAPRREEVRIDIPILSPHAGVMYVGTAFPNLASGQEAYPYLSLSTNSGESVSTKLLAGMDSIMAAEFKKELPGIVTREVSRVALKTYFQYEMQSHFGPLAGLLSGLYQAGTTAVDVRTWTALPDNFQLAHLSIPNDRTLTVRTPSGESFAIYIPTPGENMILYIRLVARGAPPEYDFMKF